ncbi:MAG: carbohydrate ABC transporter permease [Chloroflexota bacterium]|nr:carbohydrate ABC transporter permease [Chloroflexota bacterium]
MALTVVVAAAPVLWMLVGSLKQEFEVTALPMIWFPTGGLQFHNYITVLEITPLAKGYLNSLIIGIIVTAVEVLTSALAGYAFAKLQFRGSNVLFVGVLSTMMLPGFLLQMPLFVAMQRVGWLNTYYAMIVPFLITPFGIFMMRQFMLNVPTDYIDQARIDGAGELELIFRVVFPLCTQAAVALAIFVFIANWDQLFWPLLVLRQREMYTLPLALYAIQGEMATYYHLILAGATLAVIPPLVVYMFFQDKIVQGITLTGLKG